jgi:hypothetical protein
VPYSAALTVAGCYVPFTDIGAAVMKMLADTSDPRARIPGFRGACHRARIRAFSSEVDTGSREENASKQESRAPFRFHRNGKSSSQRSLGLGVTGR